MGRMEHLLGPIGTIQLCCLFLALGLALGFEFVNGFHDTANAVATVIYTHSLPPPVAVVWSGPWNLIGGNSLSMSIRG
jgi:PiT family inorganic phosphate transporter